MSIRDRRLEIANQSRLGFGVLPGESLRGQGTFRGKRLLFLDVDGVLNKIETLTNPSAVVIPGWPGPLARPLLARLKKVLDRTGAFIVLSSTWRLYELGGVALRHGFELVGIDPALVVGATSDLKGVPRAHEIQQWLVNHGPCASWAAVDDLDLWSESPRAMEGHAVRTFLASGLTVDAAKEIVKFLCVDEKGDTREKAAVNPVDTLERNDHVDCGATYRVL